MLRRALRILSKCLFLFVVVSVVLVATFRFVSPPTSGVMMQRYFQSLSAPGNYRTTYQWVALGRIAPVMGVAAVAAEDQLFAEHFGFDWEAIAKAAAHNEHSKRTRGASTISQQMVKNLFLWDGRTWVRKGLEAWFTLLVEALWPKERILETYLNIVEFGDGVFGVEAAAQYYFHKPASQLRSQEAALLAAVLPNPHLYRVSAPSPYVRTRQIWIQRQIQQLGGAAYLQELEQPH